jgi:homoserine dehydrogenase
VNLRKGTHASLGKLEPARLRSIDDTSSEYALTIETADEPGVLAAVAGIFGGHGVSIRSMEQVGLGAEARLVFITHTAREAAMQATLHDLRGLSTVRRVGDLVRVVGTAS